MDPTTIHHIITGANELHRDVKDEQLRRFNEVVRNEFISVLRTVLLGRRIARQDVLTAAIRTVALQCFGTSRLEGRGLPAGFLAFNEQSDYPCGVCGAMRNVTLVGECTECGLQCACWIDDGKSETRAFTYHEVDTTSRPFKGLRSKLVETLAALRKENSNATALVDAIESGFSKALDTIRDLSGDERRALIKAIVATASLLTNGSREPRAVSLPPGFAPFDEDTQYKCTRCDLECRVNSIGQCSQCKLQCPSWLTEDDATSTERVR